MFISSFYAYRCHYLIKRFKYLGCGKAISDNFSLKNLNRFALEHPLLNVHHDGKQVMYVLIYYAKFWSPVESIGELLLCILEEKDQFVA